MNERKLENSIHAELSPNDDYAGYLRLDRLLSAQQPLSDPAHPDEMLFIVQHQVAELWMKLVLHELRRAMAYIREDALPRAIKSLARVRHVQNQLYGQWKVLDTLTPSEYAEFRDVFGTASGFQSAQYRLLEFALGNKNRSMLKFYRHLPDWHDRLEEQLVAPSLYDEFLAHLARTGLPVPAEVIERDFSVTREDNDAVIGVLRSIYEDPAENWQRYEVCEALMDIGNNFQFWRFHHLKTVERIIGHKRGSGGSSGVPFLKKAIEQEFFPELIEVRTRIGQQSGDTPDRCPVA